MSTLQIELPPKLIPVFTGEARYRGAYGGRGSAKTRSFAKMAAVRGLMFAKQGRKGIILCGREFMNSLDESSMAEIKAAIASDPWLMANYDVGEKYIRTHCKRVAFKFAGLRHNLDSIKSKSRILILWVDEADPVSETAWVKIVPTVREHGSEIWVTWNPEREGSATDLRFRVNPPKNSKIVELNYNGNPWFPNVLEEERLEDKEKRPEQYEHIWDGDYKSVVEGAYFQAHILKCKLEKRIVELLPLDPLMKVYSFHDIGGTGARSDAYTIWIVQFINGNIHVLDYYETVGQSIDFHVAWMRKRGWENAFVWLPHDGVKGDARAKGYKDHWADAEFKVAVIPNQGAGAAMQRVEAVRRIFHKVWFEREATKQGLKALGWYHEKIDEIRRIGLGPNHDWSSHGADAFGAMAIKYDGIGDKNVMKEIQDALAAVGANSGSWQGN